MTIPSRYPCPPFPASVRFAPHRCYPTSSTGLTWLVVSLVLPLFLLDAHRSSAETPASPRIDYVVPLPRQPHETDPATIWYDDFNGPPRSYPEASGRLDPAQSYGGHGRSLRLFYPQGERGTGGRKVFFGDSPAYVRQRVRPGETFEEIYWRIYVKHQLGWTGGPAKMSRATSLTSTRWSQAVIAHVWSGPGDSLTLDPASGVRGDRVVTRHYNDFDRLRWLGNRPPSQFPVHATEESGYWVLIESHAKLNTPGKRDGVNELWIDGRLECRRTGLDWRGSYTGHGLNAVFLEAYWNEGSPVDQTRWYDNFVISTKPIGPVVCSARPVVVKASGREPRRPGPWQLEVAADPDGNTIVFRSASLPPSNRRVQIDTSNGRFVGTHASRSSLQEERTYYLRVRQRDVQGAWSAWSHWHQPFAVQAQGVDTSRRDARGDR